MGHKQRTIISRLASLSQTNHFAVFRKDTAFAICRPNYPHGPNPFKPPVVSSSVSLSTPWQCWRQISGRLCPKPRQSRSVARGGVPGGSGASPRRLCGLVHTAASGYKGSRKACSKMQTLSKLSLVSHLLLPHWSKSSQIVAKSRVGMKGPIQGQGHRGA